MDTLKVISTLMCYPNEDIILHRNELNAVVLKEAIIPPDQQKELSQFIDQLDKRDLMDLQADYVATFDRSRSLSLLLFEHVHGESRDRGQAMVDLMKVYTDNGFEIAARELPDYIPLFLEYLSQRPDAEVLEWLGDVQHILALIATRLEKKESPYRVLFSALLSLIEVNVDMADIRRNVAQEEPDDSPEALDKIWEEERVTFGAEVTQPCGGQQSNREISVSIESIKSTRSKKDELSE